jgi:D-3-phosphoglycerate dehydrogenase
MPYRVLVTTTSFIDSPGAHLDRLKESGCEIVTARGPFRQQDLMKVFAEHGGFDGIICGEDEFSADVIRGIAGRTKVISKYGVGLDRIDLEVAQSLGMQVTNTPGVNHHTVTEHAFGLLLSLVRKIPEETQCVHRGEWRRFTGRELVGKTIGVLGFGRVGREVASRAMAFGMNVLVYNTSWSAVHAAHVESLQQIYSHPLFSDYPGSIRRCPDEQELLSAVDFISLHMNLTKQNSHFMNRRRLGMCKRGVCIVNVSRGALVDEYALAGAVKSGLVGGYAADVLEVEPIQPECPLKGLHNVILTPHIGSRTYESIVRQGVAAVENLKRVLFNQPLADDAPRAAGLAESRD